MLTERRFNTTSKADKEFIIAFDKEMSTLGYDCGNIIGTGYVWGANMIIYGKSGTKSRPCATRVYFRRNGSLDIKMFLKKVSDHATFIENAPKHIHDVFTNPSKNCNHPAAANTILLTAFQNKNASFGLTILL